MILTCDRKIIDIDFRIVIIEFLIVILNTITPTFFLCAICYWICINECDDVLIEWFKKNSGRLEHYSSNQYMYRYIFFHSHNRVSFHMTTSINIYVPYIVHVTVLQSNLNIDYALYSNHLLYQNGRVLKQTLHQ